MDSGGVPRGRGDAARSEYDADVDYVPPPHERFVLCVGIEGFADRLQTLTNAIAYARAHRRTLIVDWDDAVWGDRFDRYFTVVGLRWLRALPTALRDEASVWPPAWRGQLARHGGDWVYGGAQQAALTFDWAPHAERVAVVANIGNRTHDMGELVAHVRATHWLARRWAARRAWLPQPRYAAVHLRGTDRARSDRARDMVQEGFDAALAACAAADAVAVNTRARRPAVVVVADNAEHDARWGAARPHDVRLWPRSVTARASTPDEPPHKLTAEQLAARGTSKTVLNLEAILDWFTLAGATHAYQTHALSLYAGMASRLRGHARGVAVIMAGGTRPPPCAADWIEAG